MNYYQFHIGDYASHTRNLSLLEDIAYRRLLDAYYLAERPINGCSADVAREIGMRDHLSEVEYVLGKYFEHCEDGWRNKRADREIAHFADKKQKASEAGKASAERRFNARSTSVGNKATSVKEVATDVQLTNNHKPITINQEPVNTPKPPQSSNPDGFDSFWLAYPKKVGRPAAVKAFKSARINGHIGDVLADIEARKSTDAWTKNGGQFIPNPATYLNQRRWEDVQMPVTTENKQIAIEARNHAIFSKWINEVV